MRRRMLIVALISVLGLSGCIAYFVAAISARPQSTSYRAAVMDVLDQHGVDYDDVVVMDGCAPSYQFCRTYASSVLVLSATTLYGQIDCRERWITCRLTIPELAISNIPLANIVNPMLARWEAIYGQWMVWMRELWNR